MKERRNYQKLYYAKYKKIANLPKFLRNRISLKFNTQSILIYFSPHLLGMKMRYSRFRTLLFTFTFGLAIVSIYARLSGQLEEIPVNVPKVESDTPIIIRVCPEPLTREEMNKLYQGHFNKYFGRVKGINCMPGGGGGG